MIFFQTKNSNFGNFFRVLVWKMLLYLRPLGIFYDHLVHFVLIWYIFLVLVSRTKKNLATLIEMNPPMYICMCCHEKFDYYNELKAMMKADSYYPFSCLIFVTLQLY
jgi:hypothetical protein